MINIFTHRAAIIWLKKNAAIIITAITASIIIATTTLSILLLYNSFYVINKRLNTLPYYYAHDGVIQTEEAIKIILKGKNPYTENYFNTSLEDWGKTEEGKWDNPALYHFAYLPFNIIFSIPFFIISNLFLGWFDERIVYIFSLFVAIAAIIKWPNKSIKLKALFLFIFIANPWFFRYFIEGRNDIFVLSWIILSIYFLALKKISYSSLFLALAVTSKQTAWFLLPFYFCHLYYNEPTNLNFLKKTTDIIKKTKLFFTTMAIIIVPFLFWDFHSFIDDVFKYSSGTTSHSYPISAESMKIGFQYLILKLELVKSKFDYWPFWIPQIIFCLPLLYILLKLQKRNNSLGQIIYNFFLFLMTFWLFSRFFNNNYLGVLITLFAFAIFLEINPANQVKIKHFKQI